MPVAISFNPYAFMAVLFFLIAMFFGIAFVIVLRSVRGQFWLCTSLDHVGGISRFIPRLQRCPDCGRKEDDA